MAEQRYLKQDGSGAIFIRTEALAARKDMREFFPGEQVRRGIEAPEPIRRPTLAIELQGQTFQVEQALHDVLMEMVGAFVAMQEENSKLKAEQAEFDALKERLTTDNLDLNEQLVAAVNELNKYVQAGTDAAMADAPSSTEGMAPEAAPAKHKKRAD